MPRPFLLSLAVLSACSAGKGVTVHNSAPGVSITEPVSGASFDEGQIVTLIATAEDAETPSEDLSLSWSSDLDGVFDEESRADTDGRVETSTANLSVGTHALQLQVIDAGGLSASASSSVFIVDVHQAPIIQIHNPDPEATEAPTTGVENVAFDFEAVVSDVQDVNSDLIVRVTLDDGTSLCDDVPDGSGFAHCDAVLDVGEHVVVFQVEDTDGNTAEQDALLEIIAGIYVDDDEDGFTEDEGDCDDTDDDINPDAPEIYNGVDDDCDGIIDEGTDGYDDDGDGWTDIAGDCDDADAATHPGADEIADGLDNDCDGLFDEGTDLYDDDGDCFCENEPCNGTTATDCDELAGGDCDDTDAYVYPDAPEICDTIDNDCDGDIDADDSDTDADGDGWTICSDDCDDDDADIHPGATEVCDTIDNDCDGITDGSDAVGATVWYEDVDGDGYGDRYSALRHCWAPDGYVADDADCDDTAVDIHPDADEYCDGRDNDCDGFTDESDSSGCTTYYRDYDDDGYGSTLSSCMCAPADPFTGLNDNDCYDDNDDAHPGTTLFYTSHRGDSSYDYNCDDTQERENTTVSGSCAFFSDLCGGDNGWDGSAPSCGNSGDWNQNCHYVFDWFSSGCYFDDSSRTQSCR